MVIKLMILITIALHIIAAVISLRLIKRTKYRLSWILITLGFLFLLIRRVIESLSVFNIESNVEEHSNIYVWLGIATSFFFAVGLILVSKIFDYMNKMEKEKRDNEKKFLSIIIQTEEKERERIAKDIHDGLGPLISTIKMSVSALKNERTHNKSEIIQNLELVINESLKTLKDISDNLSPHVIENFGLIKAMRNFIYKINASEVISIDFISPAESKRLPQNIEIALYRVLCELINNTIKHANAGIISINMTYDINQVHIDYSDDGLGFETDTLFKPQMLGSGFYNIFSRISSLNGSIETISTPGNGIQVKIKIPITNERK